MGGAIGAYRPTHQEQANDDAENQLFLFGQMLHGGNVTTGRLVLNGRIRIAADSVQHAGISQLRRAIQLCRQSIHAAQQEGD
jgi:hypothetical protein